MRYLPGMASEPVDDGSTESVRTGGVHRRSRIKLCVAIVAGLVLAVLVPSPDPHEGLAFRALVGFIVGAGGFSVAVLVRVLRLDPDQTRRSVAGLGGGRTEVDLVVIGCSFGALAAIGLMLFGGGHKSDSDTAWEAAITIGAVAAAWLAIHTTYTLRYAKHYYNVEPGCVDFNAEQDPQYSDFAYLAFDLGMTYQVSDTSVHTTALRRIILGHTLLSYVFGTCVIASALNLVMGLASNG